VFCFLGHEERKVPQVNVCSVIMRVVFGCCCNEYLIVRVCDNPFIIVIVMRERIAIDSAP